VKNEPHRNPFSSFDIGHLFSIVNRQRPGGLTLCSSVAAVRLLPVGWSNRREFLFANWRYFYGYSGFLVGQF